MQDLIIYQESDVRCCIGDNGE